MLITLDDLNPYNDVGHVKYQGNAPRASIMDKYSVFRGNDILRDFDAIWRVNPGQFWPEWV